jgi:hypothetical protein
VTRHIVVVNPAVSSQTEATTRSDTGIIPYPLVIKPVIAETAGAEPLPESLHVALSDRGTGAELGETLIPRPNITSNKEDVSELGVKALRYLTARPGEEVTAKVLMAELGITNHPTSSHIMKKIRDWLNETLTYEGQSFITHNGVRGLGSKYTISSAVQFTIHEQGSDEPARVVDSNPRQGIEEPEIDSPAFDAPSLRESLVFAKFLETRKELLAQLGMCFEFDEWYDNLAQANEAHDHSMNIVRSPVLDSAQLQAERQAIGAQFRALFAPESEALFTAMVDNIPADDPRADLYVDLLYATSDEEGSSIDMARWKTLDNVLSGMVNEHIVHVIERSGPDRQAGWTLVAFERGVDATVRHIVEETPLQYLEVQETDESDKLPGLRANAALEQTPQSPRELPQELRSRLDEVISIFTTGTEAGNGALPPIEDAQYHNYRAFFPWLTAKAVTRASRNNIIARGQGEARKLSLEAILHLALYTHGKNMYKLRGNKAAIDNAVIEAAQNIRTTRSSE